MARRLVEQGVAFVEVSLGSFGGGASWDTHTGNFADRQAALPGAG